jgi:UDP-N-acetylmuramoyl-tripeptide--D-alanyl-D-alanine ligase
MVMVNHTSTVGEIAQRCGGRITSGDSSMIVKTITTDSRELGENNLFVPLVGERFDGHDFIVPLLKTRCIGSFLTMRSGYTEEAVARDISEIRCDDTLKALGAIAAHHRNRIDPKVIGITGTSGKTTTKELIFALLGAAGKCLKNEKNYNNEIGVPMTLLGLNVSHETAVIEMGMNHPGELDRLSRIVKPDLAVVTNVGEGHLEFLGTLENVAAAKSEVMNGMRKGSTMLLNRDMKCLDIIAQKAAVLGLRVRTFGLAGPADVHPDDYALYRDCVTLVFDGVELRVPLYGIHNAYNAVAAVAAAREYGVPLYNMREALARFKSVEGRSRVIDRGYLVIDDSYNSNPLSLLFALRSAREIFPGRRKIAALSDMKELGDSAPLHHREGGRAAVENGFEMLLVWGDMAGFYAEGAAGAGLAPDTIRRFKTRDDLAAYLMKIVRDDDVVLVKGSRAMKMEDVVAKIT